MATTYNPLQYGQQGDDIKKLQTALQGAGYSPGAIDGAYGDQTMAAVKAYQQANGLDTDGIAGEQTLGALYGGGNAVAPSPATGMTDDAPSQYTGLEGVSDATNANLNKYQQGYTPSDSVQQAQDYLNGLSGTQPGPFTSGYEQDLQAIYNKIMNRDAFSYDLNGDALYQQYKDQYARQGKLAMMDTMGQAAQLTGGYGNSYAATAGNQAYQGYMQQLNDKVPELYSLAANRYDQQGADMYNQLGMAQGMYDDEYGKYRDTVSDWHGERDYAQNAYDSAYNKEYTDYANMLNYWQQQAGAENSDYWTQQNYDYQKESENRKYAHDTVFSLLQAKQMPTADLLAAAGISVEDAQAFIKGISKSGGGGGGQKKMTITDDMRTNAQTAYKLAGTDGLDSYLNILAENGLSASGIDALSVEAVTFGSAQQKNPLSSIIETAQSVGDVMRQAFNNARNNVLISGGRGGQF